MLPAHRRMYPGTYQFKFILDGTWSASVDHLMTTDGSTVNNLMEVRQPLAALPLLLSLKWPHRFVQAQPAPQANASSAPAAPHAATSFASPWLQVIPRSMDMETLQKQVRAACPCLRGAHTPVGANAAMAGVVATRIIVACALLPQLQQLLLRP